MDALKKGYDVIKEILSIAKKVKNQEIVAKLMDVQTMIIDAREENQNLKDEIKQLKEKIELIEKSKELEENLEFSDRGFIVKKGEKPKIPYCSHCWTVSHKLIPLSMNTTGGWWKYTCGSCKVNVMVETNEGEAIN